MKTNRPQGASCDRRVSFPYPKKLHTEHFATKSIAEPEGCFASELRKRNTPSSDCVQEHSAFSYKSTADRQRFARSAFYMNIDVDKRE
ncbi:MAG: hypothetical protein IJI34_09760 [Clostridia bacterium]|nr:hypothetical protein [Clostridia bacterium]